MIVSPGAYLSREEPEERGSEAGGVVALCAALIVCRPRFEARGVRLLDELVDQTQALGRGELGEQGDVVEDLQLEVARDELLY